MGYRKSSSSSNSSSSSKPRPKPQAKKSQRVLAAEKRARDKELEAFAQAAQKEQDAKNKVRVKAIQQASAVSLKIKKALDPLNATVTNPNILHVPEVTVKPLSHIMLNWEVRLEELAKVERGAREWDTTMAIVCTKEGHLAEEPVVAMVVAMNRFK